MKWKILPQKSADLIEQLLINRGIKTAKEKKIFFYPKLSDYKEDLQIPGINKAAERIQKAIKNGELIVVYGDYDVDGICGCAILYKGLTSIGAKVLPYIPHREKEGYGLSKLGLEFARDSGAGVVITVDNGIVALDQAKFAKEIGLDLIITDHHIPLDSARGLRPSYPDAFAIVHSTKMCGAAVAWCLTLDLINKDLQEELLQFVALATVCDLLPLLGLGRAFLVEGLRQLHKTTNLGLRSLISECNLNLQDISSYEIGHFLGPRLNAMGRLEHAIDSLRLLCTKDLIKAKRLSKLLCETNLERQRLTTEAILEAKQLIDKDKNIHILYSKNWSSGIIGLIAGRITEEYYRPTIAISLGEEVSKGSARSIDGINIIEVIRKHKDILVDVGGHPGAAGFSIFSEHIEIFKKRLEESIRDEVFEDRVLEIEAQLQAGELSLDLVKKIATFEPFGAGNPGPIFATRGMEISDIRTVGQGKHLKGKIDGIDFIAFGMGEMQGILTNGQSVDMAYTVDIDNFSGLENLQLKVKDLKVI